MTLIHIYLILTMYFNPNLHNINKMCTHAILLLKQLFKKIKFFRKLLMLDNFKKIPSDFFNSNGNKFKFSRQSRVFFWMTQSNKGYFFISYFFQNKGWKVLKLYETASYRYAYRLVILLIISPLHKKINNLHLIYFIICLVLQAFTCIFFLYFSYISFSFIIHSD